MTVFKVQAFLCNLMRGEYKRVPKPVRHEARRLLKHYPMGCDLMSKDAWDQLTVQKWATEMDSRWRCDKAERDIAELRDRLEVEESAVNHLHTDRNNLRLEVERLRAELVRNTDELSFQRDEARRECCRWMAEAEGGTPEEHAQEMGWDCFTVTEARSPAAPTDKTTQETP